MTNYNRKCLWNCHSNDHQNPILHKLVPMKHYHWNIKMNINSEYKYYYKYIILF